MTVQAWFAHNEADIEPGSSVKLALTITNLGNVTESFSLSPTGLAAAWSTIRPAYVTLFGGSQETVQVEVSPPRLAGTTAALELERVVERVRNCGTFRDARRDGIGRALAALK